MNESSIETQAEEIVKDEFIAPNARVLVVDDSSMNLKVFGRLLKKTQLQVVEADSGAICLDIVSKEHFDLIFMDHMMPEMDGVETFRRLREMDCAKDIPIIVLTANVDESAHKMYAEEGFNDWVIKPVKPDVLTAIVRKYLPEHLVVIVNGHDCMSDSKMQGREHPAVEGIDWQLAESHFNDYDTMMDTLENFGITLKRDLNRINSLYEGIETDDGMLQYRIFVHSMKSSAALVGMSELSAQAQMLENAAGESCIEYIRSNHGRFADEWAGYGEKLSALSKKCSEDDMLNGCEDGLDSCSAYFNEKAFNAYLDRLGEATEMLDMDVMDSEVHALAGMNLPWLNGREKVNELQAAVVDLDNIAIERIINELRMMANRKCK